MAKLKAPQAHAKWPELLKEHIGLLEAHLKLMDQLQQSMRAEMVDLEEEKQQFLSGEKGNWKLVAGMRERTEECLKQARKVTSRVLPQKTKQPRQTSREKERDEKERLKTGVLGEEHTQGRDVSGDRSDSEEAVETNADFVPLTIVGKKRKLSSAEDLRPAVDEEEANLYFVADFELTPIAILNGGTKPKKVKKDKEDKKDKKHRRASDLLKEPELIGKKTDADGGEVPSAQSTLEAVSLVVERRKKKKRRRSERSEVSEVEQETKRAKKEKETEKSEKKKRKAEEGPDMEVDEPAEGLRKKRKHKA